MKEDVLNFDRRSFLKGVALAGGATALLGVAGCSPSGTGQEDGESDNKTSGNQNDSMSEDASPIAPVEAPEKWDYEVDIAVVGTGGGGLAAALYAAQNGQSVIAVEKEGNVGGATRHAVGWAIFPGGTKQQNEMGYAFPGPEFDPDAAINFINPYYQFSLDSAMMKNVFINAAECLDWMLEQDGVNMLAMGPVYLDADVISGKQNNVLGMNNVVNAMEAAALAAGAEIMVNTKCETLVVEDDRVIGIKATDKSKNEIFIKAEKGVLLCAGGFGMNRALMERYTPTLYEQALRGGPMPFHTGEAFRMGLGAGADYSGFNSFSCWEGGIDNYNGEGGDSFWQYFWSGPRQLLTNAWLTLDKRCKRVPYYSRDFQPEYVASPFSMGELSSAAACMSRIDHRGYVVLDANYEESLERIVDRTAEDQSRVPLEDDGRTIATDLVTTDWRQEVKDAIDRGIIQTADTLEELGAKVGLDPDDFAAAVKRWNEICAQGEDTDLPVPYNKDWLIPLETPPYYCAKIGGLIGKTLCGLRVDENMHVLNAEGKQVPGLFANFTTAGGIAGENSYNSQFANNSLLGANALSWSSGYLACKSAIEGK